MTGPRAQDRAARGIPRWLRQIRGRLAAAGLTAALGAALAIPVLTAGAGTASATSTATGPAAASTASKTVLAWGYNAFGQLGDGTTTESTTPVNVALPSGVKVTQIRAGCEHTLALTSKGHVLAWGDNTLGQLGDGSSSSHSDTPVRADLPSGWRAFALGAGPEADDALAIAHKKS